MKPGLAPLLLAALACAGLALAAAAAAAPAPLAPDRLARELAAARKTRELVADKLAARETDVRARVRTLYKLTRGGLTPLWFEEGARADLVRRRAAARRLILRDLEERALLREELQRAEAGEQRLAAEAARAAHDAATTAAGPLARGSLHRPVPGPIVAAFGAGVDKPTRARLSRRGVELRARSGQPVVAPVAGEVLYAGPLRGLGQGVLLRAEGGVVLLVAGLSGVEVDAGARVEAGARLGGALGDRVTLELRQDGWPVDPAPYLAR